MMTNIRNDKRYLRMNWCIRNGIRIYFKPITNYEGRLVISDKGNEHLSEKTYKTNNKPYTRKKPGERTVQREIWSEAIYKLYNLKYLEYNGD